MGEIWKSIGYGSLAIFLFALLIVPGVLLSIKKSKTKRNGTYQLPLGIVERIKQYSTKRKSKDVVEPVIPPRQSEEAKETSEQSTSVAPIKSAAVPISESFDEQDIIRNYLEASYQQCIKEMKIGMIGAASRWEQEVISREKEYDAYTYQIAQNLIAKVREYNKIVGTMAEADALDGPGFEEWCAILLIKCGFSNIKHTGESGDQGVDIIATKSDIRYAIQCKRYSSNLGNTPVQEIFTGKVLYDCQVGVVMTNSHFTPGSIEAAKKTGVLLWDRDKLESMLQITSTLQSPYTINPSASESPNMPDPMLDGAVKCVIDAGQASTSVIQRQLRIGYARAGLLLDKMEQLGVVGPHIDSQPRQVLMTYSQWLEMNANKK